MKEFAYARAGDADEAAALIAERPDATYLGGGTNLVDLMKLGVTGPGLDVPRAFRARPRCWRRSPHGPSGGR
ncbi:hypothetical protein SANTM175S_00252 [Streptomyces antimycoticus]